MCVCVCVCIPHTLFKAKMEVHLWISECDKVEIKTETRLK